MEDKIKYLIELLDDDNEQNVSLAMAALLKSDKTSLDQCLRSLQESENPRLRRRVHQLESAIHARRKRKILESRLKHADISLFEGCIQLHLLWFDNDLAEHVKTQWDELKEKFRAFCRKNQGMNPVLTVKDFFVQEKFGTPNPDELIADYYSIGVAIDDHFGSDLILSVIALELLSDIGITCRIFRLDDDFGITAGDGFFFCPGKDAEAVKNPVAPGGIIIWKDRAVLRYLASMLLLCAVATDSYRYIYTLSNALSAFLPEEAPALPYPYDITR